jgi:hypothetical protein
MACEGQDVDLVDTGSTARFVEQVLRPVLAGVDLFAPGFDEAQEAWQRYLALVHMENRLAAKLLTGRPVSESEFERFVAERAKGKHSGSSSDECVLFFQEVFPFLVRMPRCMLKSNTEAFKLRLREMAYVQLLAELAELGVWIRGNVRAEFDEDRVVLMLCSKKFKFKHLQGARLLKALGVSVVCAHETEPVGLGPDNQSFADNVRRAWEFRDWLTLVLLFDSVGVLPKKLLSCWL